MTLNRSQNPALTSLHLKKYPIHPLKNLRNVHTFLSKVNSLVLVFVTTAIFGSSIFAQYTTLEYTIKRKGDAVGNIVYTQSTSASRTTRSMESDVRTRFIISFLAEGKEESVFENDIMIHSSLYREMNDKVKANKTTTLNGDHYIIRKGSKQEILNTYPIRYNLLCMYTVEPKNITKVYSDNFQQFFDIQKLGDQHYKVSFPDRNYTEYFYKNGKCVKLHVHHALYEVVIELNQ